MSVLAALLCCAALALSSSARGDELAYSCGYDICTINPDNTSQHSNLTETADDLGAEQSPAWSPDGRWIAYSGSYLGGYYQVYVLDTTKNAQESEPIDLSENSEAQPDWEDPPVWSPDGSHVAYEMIYLSGYQHHVFVSPFDGSSDAVSIGPIDTPNQGISPSWTPDGRVVFGRGSLFVANPDGTGITQFASSAQGSEPVVSPDGRYVAVEQGSSPTTVRVYKTDGTFVTMTKPGSGVTTDISWSPDSTRIAYSYHETSDAGLWVAPVDNPSAGHAQHGPAGWVDEFNATFSPDGSRIAFDALPSSGPSPHYTQIFVAPASGGEAVQVTKSAQQNWQPSWKLCKGCVVLPPPNEPGPSPSGTGGGGQGERPKPGGGTKTPTKIRLATLAPVTNYDKHSLLVGIDCHAQGGHPTGKVAEICEAAGKAYAEGVAPAGLRPLARPKPRKVLIAAGRAKIPAGQTKPLKMRITAAGAKLLKPGKTVKVQLAVMVTRPGSASQTLKKTVKVKVPKK